MLILGVGGCPTQSLIPQMLPEPFLAAVHGSGGSGINQNPDEVRGRRAKRIGYLEIICSLSMHLLLWLYFEKVIHP